MKKIFTLLTGFIISIAILNSQEAPPQAFSFKAIIKTGTKLIVNQNISLQISILQNSDDGVAVYTETFYTKTNVSGQIDIIIGRGNAESGDFSTIDWWSGEYFLKIEVDVKGGDNYELLSVTQLLSVPYALYSDKAGSALSVDYNDLTNRPVGDNVGDMQYWDGNDWVIVPAGLNGQVLTLLDGFPKWGGAGEVPNQSPILNTNGISDPTPTSFITGGYILSDGGTTVLQRGVCWNTTGTPTIENSHTNDGGGTGGFTSSVTGLTVGVPYYVRAYATNEVGTGYGNEIKFTTSQIRVTGITLNVSSMTLVPGETRELTETVMPSDAYDKNVTWFSEDASVATVSEDGWVTAVANGITTITATTNDGGMTASCETRVAQYNLKGIISSDLNIEGNSVVSVSATVQIATGVTVTVGPGTVIYGNGNELQNWGNFVAIGDIDHKITINSLNMANKTDGIFNLQYCIYNSGRLYPSSWTGGIIFKYSEYYSSEPIYIDCPYSDCLIEGNIFKNCGCIYVGTYLNKVTIKNNRFEQMTGCSIDIAYNNYYPDNIVIIGNSFMDTGKVQVRYAISWGEAFNIDASGNYWNTTDSNVINNMIFDKNDDYNCIGYVLYIPFLESHDPLTPGGQ